MRRQEQQSLAWEKKKKKQHTENKAKLNQKNNQTKNTTNADINFPFSLSG